MTDELDEAITLLEEQQALRAQGEALSTERLDLVRRTGAAANTTYRAIALALGLSDGVKRLIAADAVQLAAAEAEFSAAVQVREAMDAAIAELRRLRDGEGGE